MVEHTIGCPICGSELTCYDLDGLVLDACQDCGGVWFDAGELKPFIDSAIEERADIPGADYSGADDPIPAADIDADELLCPRCGTLLGKFNYGYDSNIILDRCPECEGLWVERQAVTELASFIKGDESADRLHDAMVRFMSSSQDFSNKVQTVRDLAEVAKQSAGYGVVIPVVPPKADAWPPLSKLDSVVVDASAHREPWVVLMIIAANVILYSLYVFQADETWPIFERYGLVTATVFEGGNPARLLSYTLFHVNIFQVFAHAAMLWLAGRSIERDIGHVAILAGYALFGTFAGFIQVFTASDPHAIFVGSSGAVVGLVGFYAARDPFMFFRDRVNFGFLGLPVALFAVMWLLVLTFFSGLFSIMDAPGEVGRIALAGTFLFGAVTGWAYTRSRVAAGAEKS